MAIGSTNDINAVWEQARRLPAEDRLALASKLLESVRAEGKPQPAQRGSLADLRGLMATDQPPPEDAEIERWLEEERMRKFG